MENSDIILGALAYVKRTCRPHCHGGDIYVFYLLLVNHHECSRKCGNSALPCKIHSNKLSLKGRSDAIYNSCSNILFNKKYEGNIPHSRFNKLTVKST